MSPKPNWTVGDFTADSVDAERLSSTSFPASYLVWTDGANITAVPQQNDANGVTLETKTGTDIGPLLYDLIVNELPPQGSVTEATGKIQFKAGEYPGDLSNATGGAVPLPIQLYLEGETQSHIQDSPIITIPATVPGVKFNFTGTAFRNPDSGNDTIHHVTLKNIQIEGNDSAGSIGLNGEYSTSSVWDWMKLENVTIQRCEKPIDLAPSTGQFQLDRCQLRKFNGRCNFSERTYIGDGTVVSASSPGGHIFLGGAAASNARFNGIGESSDLITMNNGGTLHDCRISKAGSNSETGTALSIFDDNCTVQDCVFDVDEGGSGSWALGVKITSGSDAVVMGNNFNISNTVDIRVNGATDARIGANNAPNGVDYVNSPTRTRHHSGVVFVGAAPSASNYSTGDAGLIILDTSSTQPYDRYTVLKDGTLDGPY